MNKASISLQTCKLHRYCTRKKKRQRKIVCYIYHDQRPTLTCSRCSDIEYREYFQKTSFEQDYTRGTQQDLEYKSNRRKDKVYIVENYKKLNKEENLFNTNKKIPSPVFVCDNCTLQGHASTKNDCHTEERDGLRRVTKNINNF